MVISSKIFINFNSSSRYKSICAEESSYLCSHIDFIKDQIPDVVVLSYLFCSIHKVTILVHEKKPPLLKSLHITSSQFCTV